MENKNITFMNFKMIVSAMAVAAFAASCNNNSLTTGIQQENFDTSIKPGDDFYQFACGGWKKNNPLPPEYSRYGTFEQLMENNSKQLHELIEGFAKEQQAEGSIGQKIGDLYNLAMDSTRKNKEGIEPLRKDLETINGIKTPADVMKVMSSLERRGMGGYFYTIVGADIKNSEMNLVQVSQGGLTLGEKDYYLNDDSATVKIRNAFKDYVTNMFAFLGDDAETAKKKMETVLAMETQIAKVSRSATELRDPSSNYNKMTFEQLVKDYPAIDWNTYFATQKFPKFDEISIDQPEVIHEIEKIVKETPVDAQKAYLQFHLIDAAAPYLSDTIRTVRFNFYGKTMSGLKEERATWKRAVSTVESVLGEGVGKMYVEKYFPESSKTRMLKLVKNLQKALGERIQAQTWMSDTTKAKALDKLANFYIKIGYPDTWKDYSKLKIDKSKSLYENMAEASAYKSDDIIERSVNKKVDRMKWHMDPQTINAYYNPTTNEICFPAGILQPPFFDPNADDAFNYGAIGVVIGHEMTHGFDDMGRQFDKHGNLSDWWTKGDADNFKKRAQVLIDYFNNIEVLPGLNGNGALTIGENLADHGGIEVAYQALQNAMKETPLDSADGFTPNQRFFLAYANVWRDNITDEDIRMRTKVDPHSLGRWRVNGTLPHINAWYEAFHVGKENKLYLPEEKRANIW